jgi:hypothetical protein
MQNLYLDKTTNALFTSNEDVLAIKTNEDLYTFLHQVEDDFDPFNHSLIEGALVPKLRKVNYLGFLRRTDWMVERHREEQELGVPTSLSITEYKELLETRQEWRGMIDANLLTPMQLLRELRDE